MSKQNRVYIIYGCSVVAAFSQAKRIKSTNKNNNNIIIIYYYKQKVGRYVFLFLERESILLKQLKWELAQNHAHMLHIYLIKHRSFDYFNDADFL